MKKISIILGIFLIVTVGLLLSISKNEANTHEGTKEAKKADLSISFLDVGQGDATFIEFANGEQMLVDCAIDARVIEALGRVMDVYDHSIEYLVLTHPDLDHYGGCEEVLHRFNIGTIILNGDTKKGDQWESFWFALHDEGADIKTITHPQIWSIASTTVHWMYPDHDISREPNVPGSEKETGPNNASIIMKLSFGEIDTLLLGDAEAELEEHLVDIYRNELDVDILKAGHHGSAGSSIQSFIDVTTPLHTIFSAGKDNTFGHPSRRIIRRVERAGSTVWRTDLQGDILVTIKEGSIDINGTPYYVDHKTTGATQASSSEARADKK